jgi:hypothetical protein
VRGKQQHADQLEGRRFERWRFGGERIRGRWRGILFERIYSLFERLNKRKQLVCGWFLRRDRRVIERLKQ